MRIFQVLRVFFYNFKSSTDKNTYVFLINQKDKIKDVYINNYEIIEKEENCYL